MRQGQKHILRPLGASLAVRRVSLSALVKRAQEFSDPDEYLSLLRDKVIQDTGTHILLSDADYKAISAATRGLDRRPVQTPPRNVGRDVVNENLGCVGCGGEKFAPPQTPQAQERIILDHFTE